MERGSFLFTYLRRIIRLNSVDSRPIAGVTYRCESRSNIRGLWRRYLEVTNIINRRNM